jgi:hypothetical protein
MEVVTDRAKLAGQFSPESFPPSRTEGSAWPEQSAASPGRAGGRALGVVSGPSARRPHTPGDLGPPGGVSRARSGGMPSRDDGGP